MNTDTQLTDADAAVLAEVHADLARRKAAAQRYWDWERAQVLACWGFTLDTWEEMGERYQRMQMEMVDMDLWDMPAAGEATG